MFEDVLILSVGDPSIPIEHRIESLLGGLSQDLVLDTGKFVAWWYSDLSHEEGFRGAKRSGLIGPRDFPVSVEKLLQKIRQTANCEGILVTIPAVHSKHHGRSHVLSSVSIALARKLVSPRLPHRDSDLDEGFSTHLTLRFTGENEDAQKIAELLPNTLKLLGDVIVVRDEQ